MSSTPIYDELAAILLAEQPGSPEKPAGKPDVATPAAEAPAQPVSRSGGRRRKPDTEG